MKPLVIGLTGGFAAGKSTVARIFKRLGAEIIDSDQIAHQALRKGTPTYAKILKTFGRSGITGLGGRLDRKKLGAVVFSDAAARRRLERIIHPFVFDEIRRRLRATRKSVAVVEVPLLFETGFDKKVDATVVVTASPAVQIARAAKQKGLKASDVRRRLRAQMPLSEKRRRADFIIDNNGSFTQSGRQAKSLWARIAKTAARKKR